MDNLFEQFLRERRYIHNVSETTLKYYGEIFRNFKRAGAFDSLSKQSLQDTVIIMRARGVKPGAINTYLRGINAFLRWLHENGHIPNNLTIKPLKAQKRIFKPLSEDELKAIISHKPKDFVEYRLRVILCLLIDTGLRINEALTLEKAKVDFDNMLLTVMGKGNKERVVPFSYELRKVLYKYAKSHKFQLLFPTRDGGKLMYNNLRRDFNDLLKKLDIKPDGKFHCLRRTFATSYIRSGGNPFALQRMLGHTTLQMTNEYVKLVTDDLQKEQHRTSILNRLR